LQLQPTYKILQSTAQVEGSLETKCLAFFTRLKQLLSTSKELPDSQQQQEWDNLNHLFEPTYAEI
jgi:hypothetical protein